MILRVLPAFKIQKAFLAGYKRKMKIKANIKCITKPTKKGIEKIQKR